MIWLQTVPAFAIWLAYIVARRRWMRESRARYANVPRGTRIVWMLLAILGSLAVLFAGVAGAGRLGWIAPEGMTGAGIVTVALTGLAFVHLQMLATALTLSLALERETGGRPAASNPRNSSGDTP